MRSMSLLFQTFYLVLHPSKYTDPKIAWVGELPHVITFIYLFISFFFNLGDPFNALALFFLGAQVAQGHT